MREQQAEIDFSNSLPMYKQIKDILEVEINDNYYSNKIPSEAALSKRFGVSAITVKQAINQLVYQDVLYRLPKKGTFLNKEYSKKEISARGIIVRDAVFGMYSGQDGINNLYFYEILDSLEKELKKYSYSIMLLNLEEGYSINEVTRRRFEQNHISVFFAFGWLHIEFIKFLTGNNIPVIGIDFHYDNDLINCIILNNENAGYKMTKYLTGLGHKKIGFLGGKVDYLWSQERHRGYMKALQEAGIPYNETLVKFGGASFEEGFAMMEELIKQKNLPTAVFAANDDVAMGSMDAGKDYGLKIPCDILLVWPDACFYLLLILPGYAQI